MNFYIFEQSVDGKLEEMRNTNELVVLVKLFNNKVIGQDELIRRTGGSAKTIEFVLQQDMVRGSKGEHIE